MTMPRIHPREQTVTRARLMLTSALIDWRRTSEAEALTSAEYIQTITSVFSDALLGWAKYAIREERHPDDPDTPGGWE